MGACVGGDEQQLSKHVNREIKQAKKDATDTLKVLFLGSGGAGKSTIFKQLRCLHGEGFDEDAKAEFCEPIISQIVNQMKLSLNIYIGYKTRLQQQERKKKNDENKNENINNDNIDKYDDDLWRFDDFKLESQDIGNTDAADILIKYEYNKRNYKLDNSIITAIKQLWNEDIIKEIYKLRNFTKIEDSSKYFWDKIDDVTDSAYLPSDQDILLCRVTTKGLHEMSFNIKESNFNIIDVGGQRSQRRKWIHCFEYVVAVIFIASLNCYDELLDEDLTVNAMVDQIELFDDICNNPNLNRTSMILFLNKTDLFKVKYLQQKIPLKECPLFEDYDVENDDFAKATNFIREKFKSLNSNNSREIFTHLTNATDKNNIQKVFKDVTQILINRALQNSGLTDGPDSFMNWDGDSMEDDLNLVQE